MKPVKFADTWRQENNPHPNAPHLKDLVDKKICIWKAEYNWDPSRAYFLIGETEEDAVWYYDEGMVIWEHASHIERRVKYEKPMIATVKKKWPWQLKFN